MNKEIKRILAEAAVWRKQMEERRDILLKEIDDSKTKYYWSSATGIPLSEPMK